MKALLLLAALVGGAQAMSCPVNVKYCGAAGATAGYTFTGTVTNGAQCQFPGAAIPDAANGLKIACATGYFGNIDSSAKLTTGSCKNDATTWITTTAANGIVNWATDTTFSCGQSCVVNAQYCTPATGAATTGYVLSSTTANLTTLPGCQASPFAGTTANATNPQTIRISCAPGYWGGNATQPVSITSSCDGGVGFNGTTAFGNSTPLTCTLIPNATSNTTNGTNTSNTTPSAVPTPAGSSPTTVATANAVAALGANPSITAVINILNNLPANTSSTDFVASTNVALATAYPTTGTAMTAAQGEAFVAALPSTLTSNNRPITFTTTQINLILQQIGISSRGQTAAVVGNKGQCVSNCVAALLTAGVRKFGKVCLTNACAGLRQVNGLPVVSCSGTAQQQRDCWKEAACAGQLAGVANCTVQNVAERCPTCDKSKKGLLGLLGLLGIIPLVLSSLLLSLLLLCIRRKKTAGAVQFATYDAGAQNVCVPGAPGFGPGYPATCL